MVWLISLALAASATALNCLSDTGSVTDTWLIIKKPHSTSYLYADPIQDLQPSIHPSLNFTDQGALALTSEQLWSADSYIIYNDEDPDNTTYSYDYGHTKGYLFFNDDSTGVWIQHSIPQFPVGPTFTASYSGLTRNAWTNAQHIYCMSFDSITLNTVAGTMLLNRPRISDWKLSATGNQLKNLYSLATGGYNTVPSCNSVTVKTVSGIPHTVFAKSAEWDQALWENCIAESVTENLMVQSWLQGKGPGPFCPTSGNSVVNIQTVNFGPDYTWNTTVDHSKWGAGTSGHIACFGDINRVDSQAERGGGAVCVKTPQYTSGLYKAVAATDSCEGGAQF